MQILGKTDMYYKSIAYILGICETTRENFNKIFDLKNGEINIDSINEAYQTSTSKKVTRMYQLGEEYLPKNISHKVNHNQYYYQNRYYNYVKPKKKQKKYKVFKYKGSYKSINKKSSIEILSIFLFYFLGIYPKSIPYHKPFEKLEK